MLDLLDTLRALQSHRTTAAAAISLRITQSAVSKRLAALEARCGGPVAERQGRGLRLTPLGERILAESAPHLRALSEILSPAGARPLRLGAPESLLGSWLPGALRAALGRLPGMEVELHVHRGPWLLERVRTGALDAAVCVDAGGELRPLCREPMVLVGPGAPAEAAGPGGIWTIEEASLTGQWLEGWMRRHGRDRPELVAGLRAGRRLESFGPLVQLARAGFAVALVPAGIAAAMGADNHPAGLARPIGWAGGGEELRAALEKIV